MKKLEWGLYKNGNAKVSINLINGTKIRETEDDEFDLAFAENIDFKITNRCSGIKNCGMCHEGSGPFGEHGDVLDLPFINTLHPLQELAIGGGNILEYPDLLPLLNKLHERMVITNITVNQYHFMENVNFLEELIDRELIKGIGVSLMNPSDGFILMVKQFPTAVIHTINGIVDLATLEKLYDNDLNILILGYKDLRRGHEYKEAHGKEISQKMKELSDNIMEVCKHFKHVAFDNLALEQLDMKSKIDPKRWEELYMGDEGTATFYIDGVTQTFAESSTAPLDERYPLMDSVDEMFKFIKKKKRGRKDE